MGVTKIKLYVSGNLLNPEGAGRGFNLGVGLTEAAATVTLCRCLVNTACAILTVFTSTHLVSSTMRCEETGFHYQPACLRGCLRCRTRISCPTDGHLFCKTCDAGTRLSDKSVCPFFLLSFGLSDTRIRHNLLTPKLCTKTETELRMLFLFVI